MRSGGFLQLLKLTFVVMPRLVLRMYFFNHKGQSGEIKFKTQEVGTLTVKQVTDGRIVMEFPNLAQR